MQVFHVFIEFFNEMQCNIALKILFGSLYDKLMTSEREREVVRGAVLLVMVLFCNFSFYLHNFALFNELRHFVSFILFMYLNVL